MDRQESKNETYKRVLDIPERLRPREEIQRVGVRHVSDDVLLSVLLRSGIRGKNVVDVANDLLCDYGSLTNLAGASVEELACRKGIGKVKAQVIASALELARRFNQEQIPGMAKIRSARDAALVLSDYVRGLEKEKFWVLMLDTKNNLKSNPQEISAGLLDSCQIDAREVFKNAVKISTSSIVLAHNHPSGDTKPSAEDIGITRKLIEAGKIMDIKVLDHIIMGRFSGDSNASEFLSMRDEGVIKFG